LKWTQAQGAEGDEGATRLPDVYARTGSPFGSSFRVVALYFFTKIVFYCFVRFCVLLPFLLHTASLYAMDACTTVLKF
jgi:hypothetical protein